MNAAVYLNSEEIVETPPFQEQQQVPPLQAQYQPPIQMPITPISQPYTPPANITTPQQATPPPVAPPVQQIMPTTHVAQEFTIGQIQFAMSGLVDAGKMNVVTDIIKSFNVAAITQIAKEQYPAVVMRFARQVRRYNGKTTRTSVGIFLI